MAVCDKIFWFGVVALRNSCIPLGARLCVAADAHGPCSLEVLAAVIEPGGTAYFRQVWITPVRPCRSVEISDIVRTNGPSKLRRHDRRTETAESGRGRTRTAAGGLASYPPPNAGTTGPNTIRRNGRARLSKHYRLIPTICFNCEAGCGLLAYVDKETGAFASSRAIRRIRAAADATAQRDPRPSTRSMIPSASSIRCGAPANAAKANGSASLGTRCSTISPRGFARR